MFNRVITNQTKTMVLLMLVFTAIILLFSGLVYFSIVNFSHQRFYELLKIRTATIIQIEKGKDHLDIPENYVLNNRNDEELPMEKDYVFAVPADSNFKKYRKKSISPILFFLKVLSEKEKLIITIKSFIILGRVSDMSIRIILPSLLQRIIMWSTTSDF